MTKLEIKYGGKRERGKDQYSDRLCKCPLLPIKCRKEKFTTTSQTS